jgi:hypothetical protein
VGRQYPNKSYGYTYEWNTTASVTGTNARVNPNVSHFISSNFESLYPKCISTISADIKERIATMVFVNEKIVDPTEIELKVICTTNHVLR